HGLGWRDDAEETEAVGGGPSLWGGQSCPQPPSGGFPGPREKSSCGQAPAESRRLEFLHFRLHEVMIWFVSGHGFSRAEPAHRLPIGAAGRSPALEFLHFRLHEVMIWF